MVTLSQGDQQMIIFEDAPQNQTILMEVSNRYDQSMKFGWETSFGRILKVFPSSGVFQPGETKTFMIQFHGEHLPNTEIMDADHHVKIWMSPAETRKRGHENTDQSMPIIFAVHVQPKKVMEFS